MPETEPSAGDVIDSYRRRRNRVVPLFLGGLAVVLLVVGVFLVVLWLTGESPPAMPGFLATDTPTPTETPTPMPPTLTPTITNTPEPTLTPTPSGPTEYTVEVNDTLFSIAEKFGVTMDLLISFNSLTDPNNIGVGTTLLIPPPDSELPTETAIPTGLPRGRSCSTSYARVRHAGLDCCSVQQHRRGDRRREQDSVDSRALRGHAADDFRVNIATPTWTSARPAGHGDASACLRARFEEPSAYRSVGQLEPSAAHSFCGSRQPGGAGLRSL